MADAPSITSLVQEGTTLTIMWIQPTEGGAPVIGYIVHYTRDDGSPRTKSVGSSTTSTEITGLTNDRTYTISVEATANGLSGESEEMIITLSE